MKSNKKRPQRTCIVCRDKKDKRDLIRLVLMESRLEVDMSGKMNGRGAYLCHNPNCWERAASTSILTQALRTEISEDDRMYLRQMKLS